MNDHPALQRGVKALEKVIGGFSPKTEALEFATGLAGLKPGSEGWVSARLPGLKPGVVVWTPSGIALIWAARTCASRDSPRRRRATDTSRRHVITMLEPPYQQEFWNEEAPTARFSHPLNQEWLARIVQCDAHILDYGCGYGRTLRELKELGYSNLTGFDASAGMLERARAEVPDVGFVHADGPPCPLPDESFDLVILFAVLTSIPRDDHQCALVADVARLIRPSGHLYVSDLPLQTDSLRIARYRETLPEGLPYGAFELEGGRAVMRHHPETWFEDLFAAFDRLERQSMKVATMRGRSADAVQYLFRKPAR